MSTPCSNVLLFLRLLRRETSSSSYFWREGCRRACSVVVGNVKARESMTTGKVAVTSKTNVNDNSNVVKAGGTLPESGGMGVTKDVFWMRDPTTGNWLPETHFNQVDAVELREKMLSKPSTY